MRYTIEHDEQGNVRRIIVTMPDGMVIDASAGAQSTPIPGQLVYVSPGTTQRSLTVRYFDGYGIRIGSAEK